MNNKPTQSGLKNFRDIFSESVNFFRNSKQKKSLITLAVLAVGLVSGLILVQRTQDIREKALVGGPELYFSTSPLTVSSGTTGKVYDIFMNTNGFDVTAAVIEVQFNANKMQVTSISKGTKLTDVLVPGAVSGSRASITLGSGPSNPFNGNGKVATLTFDAVGDNTQADITFTSNTQVAAIGHSGDVLGTTSPGSVIIDSIATATPTKAPTATRKPTSTPTLVPFPEDINGDGVVNILDFLILSGDFGTSNSGSDLNGDGVVDILDFQILSNNFGNSGSVTPTTNPGNFFEIDHEEGNLSEYDSFSNDDDLEVIRSAALAGTLFGMGVDIDDTTATYGQKNQTAPSSNEFRFRFYLDPNSLAMADDDSFQIIRSFNAAAPWAFIRLYLAENDAANTYDLTLGCTSDSPTTNWKRHSISDAEHYVEIHVERASSSTSSDGRCRIWTDGNLKTTDSGIDNYDAFGNLSSFRFGADSLDAGTSGILYIDEIVFRDDGQEIGP